MENRDIATLVNTLVLLRWTIAPAHRLRSFAWIEEDPQFGHTRALADRRLHVEDGRLVEVKATPGASMRRIAALERMATAQVGS